MENDNLNGSEIDRVIHFLEYEISIRRSEKKRPGWTTWAILGAIATLLWLMFSVLDTDASISWHNIFYITLLLSVSFDFLYLLNQVFSFERFKQLESVKRFEILDISMTKYLVLLLLRAGVLLILLHWISPKLNGFVGFCCWAFLLLNFITITISLAFFYLQIPTPVNPNPKAKFVSNIYFILWLVSGGVAIFGLVNVIYLKVLVLSIPEWQVGSIIFSLSLLILIFSRTKPNSILLLRLDDIRQKLSLGQIDLNRAKKQIDLIIYGLALSDILQPQINDFLKSLNSMHDAYKENNTELKVLEKFADTPIEKLNEDDHSKAYETLNLLYKSNDKIKLEAKIYKNKQAKLYRKMNFFSGMNIDTAKDASEILEELNKEIEQFDNTFMEFYARINKVENKLGKMIKEVER